MLLSPKNKGVFYLFIYLIIKDASYCSTQPHKQCYTNCNFDYFIKGLVMFISAFMVHRTFHCIITAINRLKEIIYSL